ncbi:FAST kinase domain-containing protein 2, mitochondrial isoform X2 [Hemicordylus capensis]|uniref:FAST kinase domain-containing protein 2, mitochondrial isoform X2 n=1 Tax=Hemicordylus capensis TaxID=884348 RepID=UPI002303016E|nr:FAST kinase domain-containing protein 2, mitochondrial isoform X2 [Hemicordylus capensis]
MLNSKMNKKLDCFIRTVRQLQAYHDAWSPFSQPAMRMFALGINGHKSAILSSSPRLRLLSTSPCWFQSPVQFYSQDKPFSNTEDARAEEQRAANALLGDHTQSPMTVKPIQPPSGFLVSPKEDRSAMEEDGGSVSEQFFANLQKCRSPCDVLDLASKSSVSQKYPSSCLATMWMLTKKLPADQKNYEKILIFQHPHFSQLCQCVMHEAKYMWRDDLVYSLLGVVKLGVRQNTRLVQTLLRVCQERLNEFDDRCLSVLATALQGMESCNNVEALRAGLKLLVEQRIPKTSSVFMLQTMMKCIGKNAPLTLKTELEKKILSQIDDISLPNAQHMFSVLAEMDYRSVPILNACSNKIIKNIQGIPLWNQLMILRSCRDLQYRNITLYSAVADYVASAFYMWDTKQVVLLLSTFENLGFRPVGLMDAFAEEVVSNPESLNMKDILVILRTYSALNHIPKDQDQRFLEALNSAFSKYLPRISNVDLLRTVYSFCILGYLPQCALDQLLQDEVLHDLLTSDFEILIDADRRIAVSNTEVDQSADDSKIQRLAVLCAPVTVFCVNSRHPRGRMALKMRHLNLLGYRVILVHYQEFQKLKKEEALEFLKKEIFPAEAHLGSD